MISLAVTGGIASGKTTFSRFLTDCSVPTLDADDVVRSLHAPGMEGAEFVKEYFGAQYLLPDGATDRAKLAGFIFSDAAARRVLEEKMHPLVHSSLLSWRASLPAGTPFCAVQIPLLFESQWQTDWSFSLTVEAIPRQRFMRLCARGLSAAQAQSRIDSQLSGSRREKMADFVLRNHGSLRELQAAATFLIHRFSHS